MATKYFCDGCGDQIPVRRESNQFSVTVENSGKAKISETFDLCSPCGEKLLRQADPKHWTRAAMAAPRSAA